MNIHIYILCYNEQVLIQSTINHYKRCFPDCYITIVDNHSTDNSVEIAKKNGCRVIPFKSGEQQDERVMQEVRNNVWKEVEQGWVIMCDMDEWLDVSEDDLREEERRGTNVLEVRGYEIIGTSRTIDLSDVDIQNFKRGVYDGNMSKRVCFRRPQIREMRYGLGMHTNDPLPQDGIAVRLSEKKYVLRHMDKLGLEYYFEKYRKRYERNHLGRQLGFFNGHYTLDTEYLDKVFHDYERRSEMIIY